MYRVRDAELGGERMGCQWDGEEKGRKGTAMCDGIRYRFSGVLRVRGNLEETRLG